MRAPWRIQGPDSRPNNPALEDALKRLYYGRSGPPTEADRPPPSIFPMTASARAALRFAKAER